MANTVLNEAGVRDGQAEKPRLVEGNGQAGFLALLRIEAAAREVATVRELRHFITNETWKLVRARQTFLFEMRGNSMRVRCVSSIATVDPNAPLVRLVESVAARLEQTYGIAQAREFMLDAFVDGERETAAAYPFRNFAWLPLAEQNGAPFAGLMFSRDTAWRESDLVVARRLASTFSHAWLALARQRGRWPAVRVASKFAVAGCAALAALLFIPVPMSANAPVEVIPRDPIVVAAPLEGVVAEVLVSPSQIVEAGQILLRFEPTDLVNRLEIADRALQVAEARLKQSQQGALSDVGSRKEFAIAAAELGLKRAERAYAADLLARSEVRAKQAGVVLFADRKKIIGRPIGIGEALMEIAQPGEVQLRLDMPVADALLLSKEAEVSVYLDSDPLRPYAARIEQTDYRAREIEGGRLAVKARVSFDDDGRAPPRLGIRGSGRVMGPAVPLGLYLFRRPITMVRQWLGR